jgi:hypothetical protein
VLNVVNSRVRPLEIVKAELIAQVQAITSMNYDNHHGAWRMKYLAEELAGCYYITDLIKQQKYAETWEEVGLTNLYGSDDDKTHLVLIDFHS